MNADITIVIALLAFAAWAIRRFIRSGLDDYRTSNDRAAADRITCNEDRPEPGTPGHDQTALDTCNAILHATRNREEKQQP